MSSRLSKRVKELEREKQPGVEFPKIIFLCGFDGDPGGALVVGGTSFLREAGESEEDFTARVTKEVYGDSDQTVVILPAKNPEP